MWCSFREHPPNRRHSSAMCGQGLSLQHSDPASFLDDFPKNARDTRDTLKQSTIELISTRLSTVDWHVISESAREPPSWWRSYQCESKSFLSIDQYSNNTTCLFHSIPIVLSLYKSSQSMLIEIHLVENLIQILYHIYASPLPSHKMAICKSP